MDEKSSARRTTFAELFFDLVFVFAIAEIATLIRHEATLFGYASAAVLLGLVWWGWSIYTWMGNLVDLTRPANRAGMLFATALVFLMALVLPGALDESGALFAVLYAAVRITGLSFYWAGLRRDPEGRAALKTFIPLSLLSPVIVVLAGFLGPEVRIWILIVALAIDVASALSAGRGEFRAVRRISWERLAIGVTVAALVVICGQLPGVVLTGASIAIMAVGLLVESLRGSLLSCTRGDI